MIKKLFGAGIDPASFLSKHGDFSNQLKRLSRPDGLSIWYDDESNVYNVLYSGSYFDISCEFDYMNFVYSKITVMLDNIERAENGEEISWEEFYFSVFEHDTVHHTPRNDEKTEETPEKEEPNKPDMVNHPSHYTASERGIECIDAIYACLDSYKDNPTIAWLCGQVIKYIWRAPLKGKFNEDLKKAQFYMNEIIKELK